MRQKEEIINLISGMTAEDIKDIVARSMAVLHGKMMKSNIKIHVEGVKKTLIEINSKTKF